MRVVPVTAVVCFAMRNLLDEGVEFVVLSDCRLRPADVHPGAEKT
jgi:hypothetical protein